MTPERWKQIDQIFQATLDCEPEMRASFLDEACGGDAELRHEVELLLASDDEAGSLIESPAYELAAPLIAKDDSQMIPGKSIGHYEILSRIGAGGLGEVWRAYDMHLKLEVSIQVLPQEAVSVTDKCRRHWSSAVHGCARLHGGNEEVTTLHLI